MNQNQQAPWHKRWQENRIGFHLQTINPWLTDLWESLSIAPNCSVFVPLCGKSIDLNWLAKHYHVGGCELSQIAVDAFFEENQKIPEITTISGGHFYQTSNIHIYQGDFFELPITHRYHAAFDRAALIAIEKPLRKQYTNKLLSLLTPPFKLLVITLEYPQNKMAGPPFSVEKKEIEALFIDHKITELRRKQLDEPKKEKYHLDYFDEVAWLIESI